VEVGTIPLTNIVNLLCACFVMQLRVQNLGSKLIAFDQFTSADFSGPNPSVVTFLAGDGPGTFRSTVFTIVDDNILEPDETILISGTSLSALGQFLVGGDTAALTIIRKCWVLIYSTVIHRRSTKY